MHIFYTLILHFFAYRKDTAKYYMNILKNIEGIEICRLTGEDVVRHALVQKIIEAYERFEKTRTPERSPYRRKST